MYNNGMYQKTSLRTFSFIIIFVAILLPLNRAHAALYNASGLLGQVDQSGNPQYTDSGANGGPGPLGMHWPDGSAIDTVSHRLFVGDVKGCRILVFQLDANDNIASTSASYVLGAPNFYTASPIAHVTQNQFDCGYGTMDYDAVNDRLFVADSNNNRVLVFNVATSTISNGENASYVLGQANFTSAVAATTQSGMDQPSGTAFDPVNERLFVGEYLNNRVLVFNVATSTIAHDENASYVLGQSSFTSNTAATTQSGLSGATDINLDIANERLFVGDKFNDRVLVFNVATSTIANDENASYVLGQSSFTSSASADTQNGMGTNPAVRYDPNNQRLFVSDIHNSRVLVFNVATSTIANDENASYVLGQSSFTSSAATTTQSGFDIPATPLYDPTDDHLFIDDQLNNRVLVFNVATSTIANDENAIGELGQYDQYGNPEYTTNGGFNNLTPTAETLNDPEGNLALDSVNHRLFVADSLNERVLVFPLDANGNITSPSASYVLGQSSFTSNTATTTQNGLGYLEGVAYDSANQRLFVVDFNNSRIMVFNVAPSTITNGENASYVLGQSSFTSTGGHTTQSGLSSPVDASYDPINQRLFVADAGNNRVLVFDVSTSTIANGKNASYVLGQSAFTSNTSATTQNGLNDPEGLDFVATNQRLFVSDRHNNRVLVFDVATSTIANGENASYVLGQSGFTSNIAATSQNGLNGPFGGLAYDPSENRLFATDISNNRVLIFNVAPSSIANGENAENVLGQSDFVSSVAATTQNGLDFPLGLAYDPTNNHLFVEDDTNNRILQYDFIKITTPSLSSGTQGGAYSQKVDTASAQGTVSYAFASGSLPSGLSLNPSSGAISGMPTAPGSSAFTIEADDGFPTGNFFDQASYTVSIAAAPGGGGVQIVGSGPTAPGYVNTSPNATTSAIINNEPLPENGATTVPLSSAPAPASTAVLATQNPGYDFLWNLSLGVAGPAVFQLQTYLDSHGSPLAQTGPGSPGSETAYFGTLTYAALVEFQNAHAAEILMPIGLTRGTGYFGRETRTFVNSSQ